MHHDHAIRADRTLDEAIDEAEDQSFPASDPQSSWAGGDLGARVASIAGDQQDVQNETDSAP